MKLALLRSAFARFATLALLAASLVGCATLDHYHGEYVTREEAFRKPPGDYMYGLGKIKLMGGPCSPEEIDHNSSNCGYDFNGDGKEDYFFSSDNDGPQDLYVQFGPLPEGAEGPSVYNTTLLFEQVTWWIPAKLQGEDKPASLLLANDRYNNGDGLVVLFPGGPKVNTQYVWHLADWYKQATFAWLGKGGVRFGNHVALRNVPGPKCEARDDIWDIEIWGLVNGRTTELGWYHGPKYTVWMKSTGRSSDRCPDPETESQPAPGAGRKPIH